jgi:hypothetical protein
MLIANMANGLNKLAYFQDTEHDVLGEVSVYHMFVGDRLVLQVYVQTEDDKALKGHKDCFPVWVARYNGEGAIQLEGVCAYKKYSETLNRKRVSSTAVQKVTYAMLPWLLTTLYVPTEDGN